MDQTLGTKKHRPGGRNQDRRGARGRILEAAYNLFALHGIAQVGIDTVIAKSGCAKASLYNQFGSKEGLAVAFLDRREELWTRAWLEAEVMRRAEDPEERLLAIFDLFDEWFQRPDFEGCAFVRVLLETPQGTLVNRAAADQLLKLRGILHDLAREAGFADVSRFAQVWSMLMKGSVIAAREGNLGAARDARPAAKILLASWPRAAVA
jgi:AcrR family transcriptional regulator